MKTLDDLQTTTSKKAYKRLYKEAVCNKDGRCTYCGWHSGENLKNYRKHGVQKSKKKNHR